MCGIFGWSFQRRARIPAGQREALASTLAIANSLRGDQSWGAYFQGADGKAHTRREVGDIAAVAGLGSLGLWDTFMAHTRYATTGKVTKENQHPFRAGKILLAHNGVVFNHRALNEKYDRACTVDSQHFAHHLSEDRDFSDIEAYGSIEWIEDPRSRIVNLCRMRNGVLAVYGIKNAKGKQVGCVWSSDVEHLRSAIGAARLDAFPYVKLEEGHVFTVQNGKLFTSERRLACVEPEISADMWGAWRSTQGTGTGGHTVHEDRHGKLVKGPDGCYRWIEASNDKSDTEREDRDDVRTQVDEGLYFNHTTGTLEDGANLTESEDIGPACDVCGSLAGVNEAGECRDCFTPSETAVEKISRMTDDEWQEYQRKQQGLN